MRLKASNAWILEGIGSHGASDAGTSELDPDVVWIACGRVDTMRGTLPEVVE